MDAEGRDLTTGQLPRTGSGKATAAAALAAAPVLTWPVAVACDDGRRMGMAAALGPGGPRVQSMLEAVAGSSDRQPVGDLDVEALARATPAGTVDLPLRIVEVGAAVEASAHAEADWAAAVERERLAAHHVLKVQDRVEDMEAALHLTMLLATERLDPADDTDMDAHIASGAQLWLLTGAVVSALAGTVPDRFAPWARLVAHRWWPVGPSAGHLVVAPTGAPHHAGSG